MTKNEMTKFKKQMTKFEEQNAVLVNFDKTFDPTCWKSCADRAMLMLRTAEAQTYSEGKDWNVNTNSCRWAIEQAMLNRRSSISMMQAATEYVEDVKFRAIA